MAKRDGSSDSRRPATGGPATAGLAATGNHDGDHRVGRSGRPRATRDDRPAAGSQRAAKPGRRTPPGGAAAAPKPMPKPAPKPTPTSAPKPNSNPTPAPAGHGQDRISRQARQFGDRPRWDPPARSVSAPAARQPVQRETPPRARRPAAAVSGVDRPAGAGAPVRDVEPAGSPRLSPGPGAGVPTARTTPAGSARREVIEKRTYDPRREARRKAARVALPDDVDARMLDADARRELRSLSKETADLVARHLVVAGHLLDENPAQARAHAHAAKAMAGRVGVVREAVGLAAYAGQHWAEALSELRAARRITGRPEHLAVLADCERALGRPERALAYADDPDVPGLPQSDRVELVIVLAGARADLGQRDAAVLTLRDPATRTTAARPWAVRLWYAYADILLGAGREAEAREWFDKTAEADTLGETDAGDRLLLLDGVTLEGFDEQNQTDEQDHEPDAELATYIARTYTARPSNS